MSSPPVPPEPALQAAARLLAEGRPAAAAERLAGIVAETPTYAAAHVLRATALEAAGFVDEALVSWGRAAALVPRSPLVHRERARLLASRVAEAPADALPPPEPAPASPTPAPEPPPPVAAVDPEDDGADGPLLDFGMPSPMEASDLLFTSAPPPAEPPVAPEPLAPSEAAPAAPAAAPAPDRPTAPLPPVPADWGSDDGLPPILPPADRTAPAPPPPPPAPTDDDPGLPPPDAEPGTTMGPLGWGLLSEDDVPSPPPGVLVAPDVVAPEGPIRPAAPGPEAPTDARTVVDELDDLISQLEDAPRIRPDPAYTGPEQPLDAGDVDDMASETLAKIYAAQQQYVEAAIVYEKLAARRPADAERFLQEAATLREQAG